MTQPSVSQSLSVNLPLSLLRSMPSLDVGRLEYYRMFIYAVGITIQGGKHAKNRKITDSRRGSPVVY